MNLQLPVTSAVRGGISHILLNHAEDAFHVHDGRNIALTFQNDAPRDDGAGIRYRTIKYFPTLGDEQHAITQTLRVLHNVR